MSLKDYNLVRYTDWADDYDDYYNYNEPYDWYIFSEIVMTKKLLPDKVILRFEDKDDMDRIDLVIQGQRVSPYLMGQLGQNWKTVKTWLERQIPNWEI